MYENERVLFILSDSYMLGIVKDCEGCFGCRMLVIFKNEVRFLNLLFSF